MGINFNGESTKGKGTSAGYCKDNKGYQVTDVKYDKEIMVGILQLVKNNMPISDEILAKLKEERKKCILQDNQRYTKLFTISKYGIYEIQFDNYFNKFKFIFANYEILDHTVIPALDETVSPEVFMRVTELSNMLKHINKALSPEKSIHKR